jgi:ATP-dependent exoDNAse (exonuclease V) beta subunit
VLGIPSDSNKKAELGTIVHKVLECLALAKLAQQNKRKTFDDEHFGRVKIDLENESFVWKMLDKSFEHYTHPDNTIHGFTQGDYKQCRELVETVLKTPIFDPRRRTIVDAEPHFDFELEDDWAHYVYPNGPEGQLRLKGTIDLIAEVDKDTYEVIDWKTGQRKDWGTGQIKNFYKLSDDPQLRMYHLALHYMYPKVKQFIMSIYWIRDGGPFTLSYGPNDLVSSSS